MGVELLDVGVKVRKGVIFTIRGCSRTVRKHPFLLGILCFLIFLYRLSPFIFQLLVSASPILVCTAVLLGTLLSFGQPNIPEIEVEERTSFEATSINTGVSSEIAAVEKNESCNVERFSERKWEEAEKSTDLSVGKLGEVRREDSEYTAPLIDERWEGNRERGDFGFERKSDWIEERLNNGEVMENHYVSAGKVNDALIESDDEKSEADSFDSEKVNVDSLDSPPNSPWTRVNDRDDEEEEDEEEGGSDSGSGRAESSSPDASLADIMPMLDELHPLLDEEAPRTVDMAGDGSDAASEKSRKSNTGSDVSDDDESENHDDLEVADDDNEDEEGDKEEQTKSAITWTEEDQKNLMDLGSSEVERNLRLENLILRRRARKMLADRNMIDLKGYNLPFNIAPISTRRQNPFDQPNDYYDNSGLPPLPGSAPSVLLKRRNPFDIPYDSSEEKPDLMGDGFQEEFRTLQSREPVFRRHESFNVGPSNFAPKRRDVKMRPYFVPEGSISEESSSSVFQRQSSELSESKLSSVPDTESISSVSSFEDQEERKLSQDDNLVISPTKEVPEEVINHEQEIIYKMETVSEHVGHGSQSSEEDDGLLELGQVEKKDVEVGELEHRMEDVADHYEESYNRDSSSSSFSEESERVFTLTEGEERRDDIAREPGISTDQNTNDTRQREPVYDISPRELSKNVSSSTLSDVHLDPNLGSLLVIDKRTVSSIERESKMGSRGIERDIHNDIETSPVDVDINTEFSGGDQRSIGESSSADTVILPHMSVPLKSSDEALEFSEDRNLEQAEEKCSVPSEGDDVIEFNERAFEGQMIRGYSVSAEEIIQSPDTDADEKLISTTSLGEATTVFHDKAINEPTNHLNEIQASKATVESFADGQVTQKSNMPEVREFDDYISSNINSPSRPQCLTSTSHVDVQTIFEEVDEIKEIDEGLLSELDNVGDFSVDNFGFNSTEFEKHAVEEESLSSPCHAETSTIRDVEVRSVEVNKIEDEVHSEKSREPIDIYEEDVEHNSDIQTSETNRAENIEVSKMEFDENYGHDSTYQETSGEETLTRKNEAQPGNSVVNHNYEDTFSTIHQLEVVPVGDIDTFPLGKAELTSTENEIVEGGAEAYSQDQVDADATSMLELEAATIENIDLALEQMSSKEIEKPVVLETPRSLLVNEETVSAMVEKEVQSVEDVDAVLLEKDESTSAETVTLVEGGEVTSQGQADRDIPSGMAELEASKIEDIDLAFNKISSNEIKKPVFLEPTQSDLHSFDDTFSALPVETEFLVGGGELANAVQVDRDVPSGMAELEASKIEDIDLAFKKISSNEIEKPVVLEPTQSDLHGFDDTFSTLPVETEFMVGGGELANAAQVDKEAKFGMAEVEASKIEDIDLAFKQISSKETEKPVDLEPPQAELAVGEAVTEKSEDGSLHGDSGMIVSNRAASVLEVEPIKDATLDQDSVYRTLHVVDSGETQGASEDTILPADSVLDGEIVKQLKLDLDNGSVEVEADKVGRSKEESRVKESSASASDNLENKAKAPEGSHSPSSVKGEGKVSKSSSSSSSSSSESSSSDSEKE